MLIGIDDTDSPQGMCTTYLGAVLARRLIRKAWPGPLTLICPEPAPQHTEIAAVLPADLRIQQLHPEPFLHLVHLLPGRAIL